MTVTGACLCRIIVGAPNARTTQENVQNPGAVYRCSVETTGCRLEPFDVHGRILVDFNTYAVINQDFK